MKNIREIPLINDIAKVTVLKYRCRILLNWCGKKYKFTTLEAHKDGSLYVYHAQLSNNTRWPFVRHGRFFTNINNLINRLTSLEEINSRDVHLSLHPRDNIILIGGKTSPKRIRMPVNWYPVKQPWLIGRVDSGSLITFNPLRDNELKKLQADKLTGTLEIQIPNDHLGSVMSHIYIIPPHVSQFDVGKQQLEYIMSFPSHGQYHILILSKLAQNSPPGLSLPSEPGAYGVTITKEKVTKV